MGRGQRPALVSQTTSIASAANDRNPPQVQIAHVRFGLAPDNRLKQSDGGYVGLATLPPTK